MKVEKSEERVEMCLSIAYKPDFPLCYYAIGHTGQAKQE